MPVRNLLSGLVAGVALLFSAHAAHAAPSQIRVVWDQAAHREAVIGFSSTATSGTYIRYGYSSQRSSWARLDAGSSRSFGSLRSHFVRLGGLTASTPVYFEACDSSGCSSAYWFLTAPSSAAPVTLAIGGDSRTNRSLRQQGNRLVAKTRPLAVLFGGDYTDGNSTSEMSTWLDDWQLAFPLDTVDGLSVRQAIPLVPTMGNHEDNDLTMICKLFGVDADRNGACDLRDSYYAVEIGGPGYLRAYTLNTQLRRSGYSAQWSAQSSWLANDLANASGAAWRIAQYHVPMFPRTSSKTAFNAPIFDAWAQTFYDHRMNLVEESDSHLVKYTFPVRPSGSNFQEVAAGTVYVGEGAWGAPTRTADRYHPWILGQASFAHFKLLQVTPARMEIRTVRFSGEADTASLARSQRLVDPLALPAGLSLWSDTPIGPVYALERDASGRSRLADGQLPQTLVRGAVRDVEVRSNNTRSNGTVLVADGSDSGRELRVLMGWDFSGVSSSLQIDSVSLQIDVRNRSTGQYDLYRASASWTESGASWAQGNSLGERIGSIVPNATGVQTLQLNATGVQLVRDWIAGRVANHGVILRSAGTTDGVDFSSREGATPPKLVIAYR